LQKANFARHHQPLRKWILCLYLMGLNLSNEQIAQELDLDKDDVHQMTSQSRGLYRDREKPGAEDNSNHLGIGLTGSRSDQ
jgi:hypothetical protein